MANKKRRCSQCKSYKIAEDGIVINGTFFCDIDHATTKAFKGIPKGRDIVHKAKKKKLNLNDIPHQHKLTQAIYNKLRVLQEKEWFKSRGLEPECISCGKTNMDWCCGHFKTRGSQGNLRYVQENTYLQCNKYCNMSLSGNINGTKTTRGYVQGLEDRFGLLEATRIINFCESNTQVRKWTGLELEQMRKEFNLEIKKYLNEEV